MKNNKIFIKNEKNNYNFHKLLTIKMEENRSCCVHYAGDITPCDGDTTDSIHECRNCKAKMCNLCAGCRDAYCRYCNERIGVCIGCKRNEADLYNQGGGEINYCHTCKFYYCDDCGLLECSICLVNSRYSCPIHTKFFSISTNSHFKKMCNECFALHVNGGSIVHCKDHDVLVFWNDNIHKKCKNKVII